MSTKPTQRISRPAAAIVAFSASAALLLVAAQCGSPGDAHAGSSKTSAKASVDRDAGIAAWSVVYDVLQHPRCLNCHPAGDAPLQGDDSHPHAQNVTRGPDGHGLYAMRCDACHQKQNLPGAHLPPGAPTWHLPHPKTPLVFEGNSRGELCEQMRDRSRNGGKSPEELFHHIAEDKLVLWGWDPGVGRTPVSTPHAEVVAAMRAWVDSGCACPPK